MFNFCKNLFIREIQISHWKFGKQREPAPENIYLSFKYKSRYIDLYLHERYIFAYGDDNKEFWAALHCHDKFKL